MSCDLRSFIVFLSKVFSSVSAATSVVYCNVKSSICDVKLDVALSLIDKNLPIKIAGE